MRLRERPRLARATGTVINWHETPRGMAFVTVRLDPAHPGGEPEEIVLSPSEIELLPPTPPRNT